jgi:hypothetical protein
MSERAVDVILWPAVPEIGLYRPELDNRLFPTLSQALKAYRRQTIRAEIATDKGL